MHAVEDRHAIFGVVGEMVEEMLLPGLGVGGEIPEPRGEKIHVQHGDLRPSAECWV